MQNLILVKKCSMHKSKAEYMLWRKKTNKLQIHPYSSGDFPLIRGFPLMSGLPRNSLVGMYLKFICFFPPQQHICIYIHVYMCINIKDEYYSFKK